MGSHIDTVPEGGSFDGALGVLSAIEVAQTLADNQIETRHPLEVVVWSDEEGGLSGSRGFIGVLEETELNGVVQSGITLGEGIDRIGGDPNRIGNAVKSPGEIAAFLELHVEQGGLLEAKRKDIGVVTGIVGIRHYGVTITGTPNHAGTTSMDQRKNALLAGCEFVLAVDRVVRSIQGSQVGTVGDLTVFPGAPNVIPGEVRLTVELRDLEMRKVEAIWEMLKPELNDCEARHGVTVSQEIVHSIDGVGTDRGIQASIESAAAELGLSHCLMPSGAGHDAQNLARIAPTGMIFVPSVGGISHSRQEHTTPVDVEHGTQVMLGTLLRVDEDAGCAA
jgi:N-carbamoyl-L-amino-acid hydrolase